MKKPLKKTKTNLKSKRPYGDMADPIEIDSTRKQFRNGCMRGAVFAVLAIAAVIAMAFWWNREVAHAEEYVTPHTVHSRTIL